MCGWGDLLVCTVNHNAEGVKILVTPLPWSLYPLALLRFPLCILLTIVSSPSPLLPPLTSLPTAGVPKEVHRNEARVAQSPQSVAQLVKQGEHHIM